MFKRNIVFALFFIVLITLTSCTTQQSKFTYFIDNDIGDDSRNGLSAITAWKSIDNINSLDLNPGDKILLKSGQEHNGTIKLDKNDSGTAELPVIISSYGQKKATINAGTASGIVVDSAAFIIISNLDINGAGRYLNVAPGILINSCQNTHIDSIKVHGFQKAGIDILDSPDTKVTRVHAFENGSAGIQTQSWQKLNTNLYIGHCLVENNPGDPKNLTNHSGNGIVVSGADVCLIEYCTATNNGWDMPREGNGPVGIWAWHSNRVVIQHCISFKNKTSKNGKDGGGFDFDGGITNSIMQYNLSYDNEGAGFGLYQYGGAAEWANNIIRYNTSFDDGWKNGQCGVHVWASPGDETTIHSALIYNNTIVNNFGHAIAYLLEKSVAGFQFYNNIFYSSGDQIYGLYDGSLFQNNLYWSPTEPRFKVNGITSLSEWGDQTNQEKIGDTIVGLSVDPLLILPDSLSIQDPALLKTFEFLKTNSASPCRAAGILLESHAAYDFWSNPIPTSMPDLGAFQH